MTVAFTCQTSPSFWFTQSKSPWVTPRESRTPKDSTTLHSWRGDTPSDGSCESRSRRRQPFQLSLKLPGHGKPGKLCRPDPLGLLPRAPSCRSLSLLGSPVLSTEQDAPSWPGLWPPPRPPPPAGILCLREGASSGVVHASQPLQSGAGLLRGVPSLPVPRPRPAWGAPSPCLGRAPEQCRRPPAGVSPRRGARPCAVAAARRRRLLAEVHSRSGLRARRSRSAAAARPPRPPRAPRPPRSRRRALTPGGGCHGPAPRPPPPNAGARAPGRGGQRPLTRGAGCQLRARSSPGGAVPAARAA